MNRLFLKTGLLMALALLWNHQTQAQFVQDWNWEIETGFTRSLTDNDGMRFHLGVLFPLNKDYHWNRLSLDGSAEIFPNQIRKEFGSPFFTQDSGMVRTMSLSYGYEVREYRHEMVALVLGAEMGLGYSWGFQQTRIWTNDDLQQDPLVQTRNVRVLNGLVSPYFGVTVWLNDRFGVYGQGWLFSVLGFETPNNSTNITWDTSLEGRVGATLRMGKQ